MKKIIAKIVFATGVMLLSISVHSTFALTEDPGNGGFTCPTGDKYKCAEKNGWVLYKGEGDTPVN